MRQEAQNKVTQLELDLKKAELEYETLQFELSNGMVYSNIDGVVKTIRDPDEAAETAMPVVMISARRYTPPAPERGGAGEHPRGDTVTFMSWQTYSESEATIVIISEYPSPGSAIITGARETTILLYPSPFIWMMTRPSGRASGSTSPITPLGERLRHVFAKQVHSPGGRRSFFLSA